MQPKIKSVFLSCWSYDCIFKWKEKTVKLKVAPVEQPKLKLTVPAMLPLHGSGLIVTKNLK